MLLSHHHDPRFLAPYDIESLGLTPNGKHIFTYSTNYPNKSFSLFDAETGEQTSTCEAVHHDYGFTILENKIAGELFYWSSDGVYDKDATTYNLYRVKTENGILAVEKTDVQFSTKGYYPHIVFAATRIYIGSAEELLVLDAMTFATIKTIPSPYAGDSSSNGVQISPDGKFVLFADWKTQHITVINTETDKTLHVLEPEQMRDDFGPHFLFTNTANEVIIGGKENVTVWDIYTKKIMLKIKTKHIYNSSIMDMQLSPDGKYLALIHTGRIISVYDMASGEQLWLHDSVDGLNACCFAADSTSVFISNGNGMKKLTVREGKNMPISDGLGSVKIKKIYVLPLENRLLAFMDMQAVHLNATTGAIEKELFASNWLSFGYNPLQADSAKNLLASTAYGIKIGNASGGKLKSVISQHRGTDLALSSKYIACHNFRSVTSNYALKVYDLDGKNEHILAQTKKNVPSEGLEFLGESQKLVSLAEKFVEVWDLDTKTQVWRTDLKIGMNYGTLDTHEAGTHIFVQKNKQVLTCLDAENGRILWVYEPRKEKTKDKTDKSAKTIEFRSVFGRHNYVICLMQNGDLRALDLATGEVLHRLKVHEEGSVCAALAPDNSIFIINIDTSVSRFDLQHWLGKGSENAFALDAKTTATTHKKAFEIPSNNTSTADLITHFQNADWIDFVWKTDAQPLIELLNLKEKTDGVNELHYICSQKLLDLNKNLKTRFFKLAHRYGHFTDMVAFGASPDGRFFATGSWVGDDYDAGGELMIWDTETGRCINKMHSVEGGIGWPDYSGCIKWSPDGSKFALSINTNGLAEINPFTDDYIENETFYETDGWSRPMQWCWQPEAKAVFLACWADGCKLPGCVAPLDDTAFPMVKPYGFNQPIDAKLFTKKEIAASDNNHDEDAVSPLTPYRKMGWSSKGFLFGQDHDYAYTLNPQTRALGQVFKKISSASAWSPDGDYFLKVNAQEIQVFATNGELLRTINVGTDLIGNSLKDKPSDASSMLEVSIGDDGMPTLLFGRTPVKDIEQIYWHNNVETAAENSLFAVGVLGEFGYLAFYQNFELLGIVKTDIFDIGSWSLGDALPFAFSPDGSTAASLSKTRKVTIWDLKNTANGIKGKMQFAVNSNAQGIFYPKNERIITIHESEIHFYDTQKGKEIATYSTTMETDKPDLSFSPLGKLGSTFNINPYFPIAHAGETHWIAAFETGLVICDKPLQEKLAEELTYAVGNRHIWQYNWAKPHIVNDLKMALQTAAADIPLSENAKTDLLATFEKSTEKDPNDYFLTVTKAELFGKNKKVGNIQFDDNSRDFYKDTKSNMKTPTIALALKAAKDYHAPTLFKNKEITFENIQHMIGKVVLYKEKYAPTQVRIGTVLNITKDTISLFSIDFKDGKQNGSGSSNTDFDHFVRIGLAEMRT
jgi:WD40 repeat protein